MPKDVRYVDPLTDDEKEVIFGVKIEYLTPQEIVKKYGDILTEEQKNKLDKTE